MQENLEAFQQAGVTVVGISADSPEDSAAFAEEHGITFPLLSDADLVVLETYGVRDGDEGHAIPTTVIVDRTTKVSWIYVGERAADRPLVDLIFEALPAPAPAVARRNDLPGPEMTFPGGIRGRRGAGRRSCVRIARE